MLRESLRNRLEREPDLRIVGECGNGDEAMALARDTTPDVVIMDIDMSGRSCFEAARIIQTDTAARVLFLSAFQHDEYISQALAVKARGYVVKGESLNRLIEAIRAVARGEMFFSEEVWSRLVVEGEGVRLADELRTRKDTLSPREKEVLRYLAQGLSRKEMAELMHISAKTAARHVENIMHKLDIHDRLELARFAIREGIAEV